MTVFKDTKDMVTQPGSKIHWVRLLVACAAMIALSFGIAALAHIIKNELNFDLYRFEWLAYSSVFVAAFIANATIVAPVPFAVAIMVTAATNFNPVLVALCAACGGTLGELSGYYAGRLGRKIAISDSIIGYNRIEHWINKYGIWAIFALAFQPIIPFDVGGLIAGAAKMPIYKFLPALFAGKFPKYILLTYAGLGMFSFLPSWLIGS